MRYLLDTCVISELTKKEPAENVLHWLGRQDELSLYLSVITFGELEKGIVKLPECRKRRRLEEWVNHDLALRFIGRILPVDREVACRWGSITGAAERQGRKIPVLDGLLCATALVGGLTLVTRNIRDMQSTGVNFLDPWED